MNILFPRSIGPWPGRDTFAKAALLILVMGAASLTLAVQAGSSGPSLPSMTAYVTDFSDGTVTPIDLATNTLGAAITVGSRPRGVAITPDGKTAYVTNFSSGSVTPIDLATNTPGAAISVGGNPNSLAIAP